MKSGFLRSAAALSLVAGAMVFGAGRPAHAAVSLTLTETGGPTTTVNGVGSVASFVGPFGSFILAVEVGDSTGSTPNQALLTTLTSTTRNTASGTRTLTITVTETFDEPYTPIMILNSSLATTALSSGGTLTFQSFVETTPSAIISVTGETYASAATAAPSVTLTSLPATYTVTSVTVLTLGAGGNAGATGTSRVTPTPEPATLVSAIVALPLFGIGAWVRRRRAQA